MTQPSQTSPDAIQQQLHQQLRGLREAMLWKVEGLPEPDLRTPLTPTGTNLLGLLKHLTALEFGHFGTGFGRPVPDLPMLHPEADPAQDFIAEPDEDAPGLVSLYRQACEQADELIASQPMDTPGTIPWWPAPQTTLGAVLVHHLAEVARHVGHADILRELLDGRAGLHPENRMLPTDDPQHWEEQVERARTLAKRAEVGALDASQDLAVDPGAPDQP
ncbi:DinB family protein [Luteococcus peritonei]|uniref:DinB family protein n=1 Tax=Luteococcus peritonei TaxID=88874 RepID=A0ABW4RTP5_9ACTN